MGSVFLDNVDDYLAPSQACINPLFTSDRTPADAKKDGGTGNRGGGPAEGGAEIGGTAVKPRRMRVMRRKASGASSAGSVGAPTDNVASASDAMDIDDLGAVPPSLSSPAAQKSPSSVGASVGVSSSRKRPPIALSYNGQDDAEADASQSNAVLAAPQPKKPTVSVADCLACSGCVTSAEAVLVQSHSISTLREHVQNTAEDASKSSLVVFTISPASLADLIRNLYGVGGGSSIGEDMDRSSPLLPRVVLGRLTTFLHQQFGARLVIDGSYVQELSLIESAEEFCARYVACKKRRILDAGDADTMETNGSNNDAFGGADRDNNFPLSTPSIALSATETRYLVQKKDDTANTKSTTEGIVVQHEAGRDKRLDRPGAMAASTPVLTSSCPGFVCYVEKTAPAVIPNLSTAKSPMACSGALVKHLMPPNSAAANIYHVAIMPCHDKKLEAGRKDLAWERGDDGGDTVPDVDLVLTTSELLTILSDATAENRTKTNALAPIVTDEMDVDVKNEPAPVIRSYLESMVAADPTESIDNATATSRKAALLSLEKNGLSDAVPSDISAKNVRMIGSGGYAEFCFRYAARKLFGFCIPDDQLLPWQRVARARSGGTESAPTTGAAPIRRRRTARGGSGSIAHSDMSEVALYQLSDGSYSFQPQSSDDQKPMPVLKFATAYGFKNVQLVLLKIGKRGETVVDSSSEHTPDYFDFIEVMACPSGCMNGGGQIRDDENGAKRETPAETRERVGQNQAIMNMIGTHTSSNNDANELMFKAYTGNEPSFPSGAFSEESKKMLHTRFHVVPKLELSTGATAGVALDDTVW